ncbi:hypothetical protein GGR56DRAFT_648401 [Xylariaceae sp. FL0804]|nr:hypothetical protein GGR56DRAFT_648401 [Xylariaceae sp. FL0804]
MTGAMSLRIPAQSGDARVHRDDDTAFATANSHKTPRPSPADGAVTTIIDTKSNPGPADSLPSPSAQWRRVVIPDPVAFRYLEEDKGVSVVERKQNLTGYELYLVEQWACSRQSPTLVIVTYTGDEKHSVVAGVLAVPADESAWSHRLRLYFKAIQQYHARPKDTPLGELMVTNLSSFPSALTVIPVPDGDIKKHRRVFIVNEDLKRLGCSGRAGMTLSEPTGASKSKFYQLYRVDDKIPFADAVLELIKLCQVALCLFGNLDQVYIDGLLCDVTEPAIGDWWTEFGAEYYNIEPTDGIMGPTTVAALLGLLVGARNRLNSFGAPVVKDVFDIDATERGISYFQKYQKLERTRKLDRQTMQRLHTVTAKAAAGEGWGVQKAVKSTVSEIGGKRGEIVLGMVSGRDKGGIGDIETVDLDSFVGLASGERAKWLWHGKPKRAPAMEHDRSLPDMSVLFGKDDVSPQARRGTTTPQEEDIESGRREKSPGIYSAPAPGSAVSIVDAPGDKDAMRKGVFKNVARDARSGLGRIKDAMTSGGGLRGHSSRPSKDESYSSGTNFSDPQSAVLAQPPAGFVRTPSPGPGNGSNAGQLARAFTWKNKPDEYLNVMRKERETNSTRFPTTASGPDNTPPNNFKYNPRVDVASQKNINGDSQKALQLMEARNEGTVAGSSATDSTPPESVVQSFPLGATQRPLAAQSSLHRRHSVAGPLPVENTALNEARWPRRLSFGEAEEALLRWEEITDMSDLEAGDTDSETVLEHQAHVAEIAGILCLNIASIENSVEPWVERKIKGVEDMHDCYARQQDELTARYHWSTETYQNAKQDSQDVIAEQRAHMTEALKEVEVQTAKLEYEINALVSRVQDVEDGVAQFELQVEDVERRADELKAYLETESWVHWAVRTLTGIGTGPNITRPRRDQRR